MSNARIRGLLDTNTIILLPRLKDPQQLPEEPAISTITLAELSVGPLVATDDSERAALDPIPFDAGAARAFGRVAADLRARERKPRARAYDALIAAVAISSDLPPCSRSTRAILRASRTWTFVPSSIRTPTARAFAEPATPVPPPGNPAARRR